ncbi:plasmid pRiA4b ORF-3 family protein [Nocardia sp. BMG51109]|uniref:plasmid pRiA4b ORF-3 family protein n=1 Tax=Nocardia sp. BMG51109 TaxID=1056816 RepID=UPI000467BD30|nr:plasmid pRiA4b ORF-3 family protein [Nocardia sp. BMG51109]
MNDDQLGEFAAALPGKSPEELRALLGHIFAVGREEAEEFPVPSRRTPRRSETVTYRVRVDLTDTKPPLWRRLEISSDLFLDELHEILQIAFGWTDSHLHQFGSGPRYYDLMTEYYLCPYMAEEGDRPGIPEQQVRLDEVLRNKSDTLFYCYDFGDDWLHAITLEEVLPDRPGAPAAVCIKGRLPGPPEDCGGVPGYELLAAATDPEHRDHDAARLEFIEIYGAEPPRDLLTPFDPDDINQALASFVRRETTDQVAEKLPPALADLLRTAHGMLRRHLLVLIDRARLDTPVPIDTKTAAAMVSPYSHLLEIIGDGVKLTKAGFLPPAIVEEIFTRLHMGDEWIGKGNREDLTPPVHDLRTSAVTLGLLRKYQGRLRTTAKARALQGDPLALWHHITERFPATLKKHHQQHGTLLYLIALAAGETDDITQFVGEVMPAIGWQIDGGRMDPAVHDAVRPVTDILDRMGLLRWEGSWPGKYRRATEKATVFSRAVLAALPKE